MSAHPEDTEAYIAFLEQQVDTAHEVMTNLLDWPRRCRPDPKAQARRWLAGTWSNDA